MFLSCPMSCLVVVKYIKKMKELANTSQKSGLGGHTLQNSDFVEVSLVRGTIKILPTERAIICSHYTCHYFSSCQEGTLSRQRLACYVPD